MSYSRPIIWDATVHVTAFTDLADRKNSGLFAGISVPLGEQISGSSGANSAGGRTNGYVDIAKTMQPEPGSYGWRVRDPKGQIPIAMRRQPIGLQSPKSAARSGNSAAPWAARCRRGARWPPWRAGCSCRTGSTTPSRWSMPDLADIEVLYENRPVGKTNSTGKILIPGLRSYQKNQVAIDPRDLPINAEAMTTQNVVAPTDRGGVMCAFRGQERQ